MSNADKLRELKNKSIELGKQEAWLQSTLAEMEKRKTALIERCKTLGVDPKNIATVIAKKDAEFQTLVSNIEAKLNGHSPAQVSGTDDDEFGPVNLDNEEPDILCESESMDDEDLFSYDGGEEAI